MLTPINTSFRDNQKIQVNIFKGINSKEMTHSTLTVSKVRFKLDNPTNSKLTSFLNFFRSKPKVIKVRIDQTTGKIDEKTGKKNPAEKRYLDVYAKVDDVAKILKMSSKDLSKQLKIIKNPVEVTDFIIKKYALNKFNELLEVKNPEHKKTIKLNIDNKIKELRLSQKSDNIHPYENIYELCLANPQFMQNLKPNSIVEKNSQKSESKKIASQPKDYQIQSGDFKIFSSSLKNFNNFKGFRASEKYFNAVAKKISYPAMKQLIDKQPNELMKIRMMRTFVSMGKTMVTVEGPLNREIYKKREAIIGENKAGVIEKKRGAFAYAIANNAIYIGLGEKVGEGTSKIVSSAIKINHFNPLLAQKKQIEPVVRVKIRKQRSEQIKKYLPHQLAQYNKRLNLTNAEIEREANSLDALKGDHIIKGYEFRVMSESPKGLSPQLIMFQTKYQTYKSLITNKAAMRQKLNVLTGVAQGLASIHAKGKAHLDMKPDNMLIEGNLKSKTTLAKGLVADVGTVKEIGQEHASGTIVYFSPQLLRAYHNKMTIPADIKEDSFSFGLTLYQLLTNQPYLEVGAKLPTEFYNLIYAIQNHVENEDDFNSAVNEVIEKMKQKNEFKKDGAMLEVLDICKNLLTYNPQARMSCKEAAVALEKVQEKYHLA